jgi:antitoxin StbD
MLMMISLLSKWRRSVIVGKLQSAKAHGENRQIMRNRSDLNLIKIRPRYRRRFNMLLDRSDQAISSTELQKNTRMLLDRLVNGSQDHYVVIRDNRPAAVMLPTAYYEALLDELTDLRLDAVARERLASLGQAKLLSHADMLTRFGDE